MSFLMFNISKFVVLSLILLSTSACSIKTVKPWERGILARESMKPEGHPLIKAADDKIYFSKEASSGGQGVGGGGCGCN